MPGPYSAPYGRHAGDGDAVTNSRDSRARTPAKAARAPSWPAFLGQGGAEARRLAKGDSRRADAEILRSMWGRPPAQRTPWPTVGQAVHFVREEWGDPEPAVVLEVQDPGDDDPNLRMPLHDASGVPQNGTPGDPAPWCVIQTDDGFVTRCREARVRGAAGWLVP